MSQARELKSVPSLKPSQKKAGKQDFDLNGDARELFEKVAARFGLQTVFDGDYPTGGTAADASGWSGVDYREAMNELEAATGSFVIPFPAGFSWWRKIPSRSAPIWSRPWRLLCRCRRP